MKDDIIKDMFLGLALADALGVPVEFKSRAYLSEHPVSSMLEYGTHNQSAGTWSDDSSLTFCLAYSLQHIMGRNNACVKYVEDIGKLHLRTITQPIN